MPRVIPISGIIDDGTLDRSNGTAIIAHSVEVAYGEHVTLHLRLSNPSGRPLLSTSALVITYGARDRPLPAGQPYFQHIGVIALDGGWDLAIVPADYAAMSQGSGRFVLDIWLTDGTVSPPQYNPVQPLVALIVKPSSVSVTSPSTSPVPSAIVAYGLPTPTPGYALIGTSGAGVAWASQLSVGADGAVHVAPVGGKLGLYGATAVVQPTAAGATAGYVAHSSADIIYNGSTSTGGLGTAALTFSDVVAILKRIGATQQ